jgi:ActR/RegA family two-component response regulator
MAPEQEDSLCSKSAQSEVSLVEWTYFERCYVIEGQAMSKRARQIILHRPYCIIYLPDSE